MTIIPPTNRKCPLLSGGRFYPLSRANVTTTLHQLLYGTSEKSFNHASHTVVLE